MRSSPGLPGSATLVDDTNANERRHHGEYAHGEMPGLRKRPDEMARAPHRNAQPAILAEGATLGLPWLRISAHRGNGRARDAAHAAAPCNGRLTRCRATHAIATPDLSSRPQRGTAVPLP